MGKTKKVATGPRFSIGAKGWALTSGQKLTALDSSFNAYVKAKQAANWAGKVSSECTASPIMKKWTAKLILATTQDDIKFSKMFWKGALELNMAIGRGKNSKFAKFLGKKILGIKAAKKLNIKLRAKAGLKVKGGLKLKVKGKKTTKKTGLKLKLKGKKTTKKAGLKLKIGAKKPKAKAGLKIKVGAKKPKASLKLKAKVGAKAKVSVKKPKAKVSLKVKAKKQRRLQTTAAPAASTAEPTMNVSSNGVNLASPEFQANVPQPTGLAGDGQSSPSKSWMMFAGMMTLVALLLN